MRPDPALGQQVREAQGQSRALQSVGDEAQAQSLEQVKDALGVGAGAADITGHGDRVAGPRSSARLRQRPPPRHHGVALVLV